MEEDNRKKLISEKIIGKRLTPLRAAKYTALAVVCGLAFGLAAAAAFKMVIRDTYVVPTESSSAADETPEETMESSSAASSAPAEPEESLGEITDPENEQKESSGESSETEASNESETEEETLSEEEQKELEEENYRNHYLDVQKAAVALADCHLVSISATSQTVSWFDDETESVETYSGIIIGMDEHEIQILCVLSDASDKSLKVTFNNGSSSDAYIKQQSVIDGLTIVAVSATEGISDETLGSISPVEYAAVDEYSNGDNIIAVGSALGIAHSCDFGNIGYIDRHETGIDCEQQVVYSSISGDAEKGTFIINYKGELIGLLMPNTQRTGLLAEASRIISISSFEKTLSSLVSGTKQAYLGISGISVSFGMRSNNIPEGVYIDDMFQGSPAYNSGIKRGDVITQMAGKKVTDMQSLMKILDNSAPGDTISIKVMRSTVNSEYREIELSCELGER